MEQSIYLAVLDGVIVRRAKQIMFEVPPYVPLRTLDAIQLATCLSVVTGALFTKNVRIQEAALLLEIPLVE